MPLNHFIDRIYRRGKFALLICSAMLLLTSCYKYHMDTTYAAIDGQVLDKTTGAASPFAAHLGVVMTPSNVTNGTLILDSTGRFVNTRILPGTYTIAASANDPFLYAFNFTTDTLKNITLTAGQTVKPGLKISLMPWVTVTSSIGSVTSTSITVNYTIKSNTSHMANELGICWDTLPGTVDIKTAPLDGSDYNSNMNWNNFIEPTPPNTNPQTNVDGSYSYTITGLTPNTTYYFGVMARIPNDGSPDPKGNSSGGKGDWWNSAGVISTKTSN